MLGRWMILAVGAGAGVLGKMIYDENRSRSENSTASSCGAKSNQESEPTGTRDSIEGFLKVAKRRLTEFLYGR